MRTIRYYDRIGLLKPARYSDSGQRLYDGQAVARLQQILTLKFIGLALKDIRALLTDDPLQTEALLVKQRQILAEKQAHLSQVIASLDGALAVMGEGIELASVVRILEALRMADKADLARFFNLEQQEILLSENQRSLAEQKVMGEALQALFADIMAAQNQALSDPAIQALVQRWDTLLGTLGQGQADLVMALEDAYVGWGAEPNLADEAQDWLENLHAAAQFIRTARQRFFPTDE